MSHGTLYVVATPIGNLADLSPRAKSVLDAVDLVAAEDTRVTGRLLSHFGLKCRQIPLHDHNEAHQVEQLIGVLKDGQSVALVSDAGTPLISDPGFKLLESCHANGIHVSPVPGPSALLAALSVSGLPTDRFVYEGFLPAKSAARNKRLVALREESRTSVYFESVHRIDAMIDDLIDVFGADRRAFIGRELTKMHEQCVLAPLNTIAAMLRTEQIVHKGEFVVVVEGLPGAAADDEALDVDRVLTVLLPVLPGKQAVATTAKLTGRNRNEIYQRMLALKDGAVDADSE